MPLRDYRCDSCGATREALIRRQSDEDEMRCPSCGGTALTRQLSAPAVLPGSGGGDASCAPSGFG